MISTIPYTRHTITSEDEAAVLRVLHSDRLTQGPEVEAFEAELATKVHAKYAIAVSSGTAALHLAYLTHNVGPDKTVWTSPVTFVATANAALYCDAVVRFSDGPAQAVYENEIWVPVTLGGEPAEIAPGATVIVDACHGPLQHDPLASATCFSFHPAKHVAGGEGGAVATDNEIIAGLCRMYRDHGRGLVMKLGADGVRLPYRPMQILGYNYRMDEMTAALCRSQLTRYDANVIRRRQIAAIYDEAFSNRVQTLPHRLGSARHLYQILVENVKCDFTKPIPTHTAEDRDTVRMALATLGIDTQVHYHPIVPLQPYYRERFGYRGGMWPNAEWHSARTLSIPLYPTLEDGEIEHVIKSVLEVCE